MIYYCDNKFTFPHNSTLIYLYIIAIHAYKEIIPA